ncbi:GTPase family protein [Blautia sp. An81]|uniref:GTPase family protein n=1 Tax=Blautia sp. An81 TaxID=1965659 RepID=UPI00194F9E49|nr:GTPase [Blautia sp. An81]
MTVKNIEIPVISEDDLKKIVEESAAKSVCGEDTHKNDAVDSEAVNEKEKSHTRKDERVSIYDLLEEEIMKADMPEADKTKRLSRLLKIRGRKVNIMLAGATGSGKSSTINALFNMEVAKVGVGVDPETDCIAKYELDNLTIWDTPGLGDGVENDERITRDIIRKLNELGEDLNPLIDMVVVILDASSKDLGTSYDLINKVLIPCLGEEAAKTRILIALNQSDIAMKGNHWDSEKNEPDKVLKDFLKKKADSVQKRIKEGTGLDIKPICYCAGYKEEGGEQRKPYNLTKLLYYIVKSIPKDKRLALADNINDDKDNWLYDDKEEDYRGGTRTGFCDTVWDCLSDGASAGCEIGGEILGIPGKIVGGVIGGAVGAIKGVFCGIFG